MTAELLIIGASHSGFSPSPNSCTGRPISAGSRRVIADALDKHSVPVLFTRSTTRMHKKSPCRFRAAAKQTAHVGDQERGLSPRRNTRLFRCRNPRLGRNRLDRE